MPFPFDAYLKSIQKNLQKGSERSHYPALKDLLDDRTITYLSPSLMKWHYRHINLTNILILGLMFSGSAGLEYIGLSVMLYAVIVLRCTCFKMYVTGCHVFIMAAQ